MDTSALRAFRTSREWKKAVGALSATSVFAGIPELLTSLRGSGVSVAVVTTSVSYYASAVMRHHSLPYDTLIAYHDAPIKPLPASVLLALDRLGIEKCAAIGVGDNENDCLAYHAAGISALGAGWSPYLKDAEWDATVPKPDFLPEFLKRNKK